jgi:trans-aconitate methyltransferase
MPAENDLGRPLVAITVDYETWQPIPPGKRIDWDRDVFEPADRLMATVEAATTPLTFMAEMGEYFWLEVHQPELAKRMLVQWQDAIRRGHDVQLHLHPAWLPELGARCHDGQWFWDLSKANADEYPGDLNELIGRAKQVLERALQPIDPNYKTIAFRAGSYMVQPFQRLWQALVSNGIIADTSVYAGGCSVEWGHDYRLAYSKHQPYFANPYDPQLKAPPAESQLVEIPVFTVSPGHCWFLDNEDGRLIANRLQRYLSRKKRRSRSSSRFSNAWVIPLTVLYNKLLPWRAQVNRLLPRRLAYQMTNHQPEHLVGRDYFVMIGHTKADLHHDAIALNLRRLRDQSDAEFVTLASMTRSAQQELKHSNRPNPDEEARYQVRCEYSAVMGEVRNSAQSYRLQEMVPLDRTQLLDLGCGAGYWSDRLARLYPWLSVIGVDCGKDFIQKAKARFSNSGCRFETGDFSALAFESETFDCIYADNTLEHAFDPSQTLREAYRILTDRGVLVAAIPSDARNPQHVCDNHTWKTVPHEVRLRLIDAGFVDIRIDEIDTYREIGMAPFPPALDRMMYVRAWKRTTPADAITRAREVMAWIYRTLEPEPIPISIQDPRQIVRLGRGSCASLAIVLGSVLRAEGLDVSWLTMKAENHPLGHGRGKIDSHEVILLRANGREVILDPTSNTLIPHAFAEVLAKPRLAAPKQNPDERYLVRRYAQYSTSEWYRRVVEYCLRADYTVPITKWTRNEFHGLDLSGVRKAG